MVAKTRRGFFYINKKREENVLKNFGTTDIKKLQKIIEDILDNGIENKSYLSAKERREVAQAKISEAKADRVKDKESLHLRKLEAETELLERQLNYSNNFGSFPSNQAKSAMKKGIERNYSNYGQQNITETIQPKKNHYIEKQNFGYVGKCIVCKKFETDLCSTGYEAEGDIELHLESVHKTGLFQK